MKRYNHDSSEIKIFSEADHLGIGYDIICFDYYKMKGFLFQNNPKNLDPSYKMALDYTARQCSSLRRKFMEWSIINPALLPLMKHLVIVQWQKAPNFSAFHWSSHASLGSIGQHFIATRVVHLPKRTKTSLITESDLITELDQAVWA